MSLQVCFGTVGLIVVVTSQAQSIVGARTLDRHFLVLVSYLAAAQQGPESLTQFMQLCIGHVLIDQVSCYQINIQSCCDGQSQTK